MFSFKHHCKPIYIADPAKVVEAVLGGDIGWFDYKKMPYEDRLDYFNKAQQVLQNNTFKNEITHIIGDLVQHIAKRSKDWQEVNDLRMTINGLQLLIDRLEGIENPQKVVSEDHVLDAL